MDRYCVLGNPIDHSESLLIHHLFAEQADEALVYDAQLAPLDDFPEFARRLFEQGKGANAIVPFKEETYRLVDELSEWVTRAGMANTPTRLTDGRLRGDNIDGVGLLRDPTTNVGVELRDERVLLLGAGSAVCGVPEPFLGGCLAEPLIANRTVRKTVDPTERFVDLSTVRGCDFIEVEGPFDLVVNGASASLAGGMPPPAQGMVEPGCTVCYDMMYVKEPTVLNRWAAERGAACALGGLSMLMEQAVEAFLLWRDVRPVSAPVLETLRRQLAIV